MHEDDESQPPADSTAEHGGEQITDDETPLGDTPEAHDEIDPHDIPLDNPGREEAERQAT